MKISLAGVFIVLAAFALGFFARGLIESQATIAPAEATPASPFVQGSSPTPNSASGAGANRTDVFDAEIDTSSPAVDSRNAALRQRPSTRRIYGPDNPQARAHRLDSRRTMLAEFFRINGIDESQGEQILQKLIDLDMEAAARLEDIEATLDPGAPGVSTGAAIFENEDFLRLEQERIAGKRDILGAYYDAYRDYKATYQHQAVLNSFSSRLDVPINIATRQELLRILIEETPQPPTQQNSRTTPEDGLQARLMVVRARNAATKQRARSYLTQSEFELFAETLDVEEERLEMSLKMMELSRR